MADRSFKTVREILDEQRLTRAPEIEIALQDFLELSDAEQREFLLVGLLMTASVSEWCKNTLAKG